MVRRPRSAAARPEHVTGPVRTCIGCRARVSNQELLRVVADGEAAVVDQYRRRTGRGVWLHPSPDCLAAAEKRKAFARGLRVSRALDVDGVRQWVARHAQRDRV
ncbi:YlxR family protein [Tamaricihabitans halophyticus]|uniref:YlxR family protein n=1 Tax=Tamaricihabitans halophyticus TaxID=1262583 RepID=UPI00104923C1|nr:YlxR family protein [Tamaricihabitans halophyticus]